MYHVNEGAGMRAAKGALVVAAVCLSLLVGLIAVGCGGGDGLGVSSAKSTASPTSSTAPVPTASHYENAEYGFSFDYPTDWVTTTLVKSDLGSGGSYFAVACSDSSKTDFQESTPVMGAVISVTPLTWRFVPSLMDEVLRELVAETAPLYATMEGLVMLRDWEEVNINGLQGFTTTFRYLMGGVPTVSQAIFLFLGDREYQFTLQGTERMWEELVPGLDMITSSFRAWL